MVAYLEMVVFATCRDGPQQSLIFEGDRVFTVCPTASENFIDPQFQKGRGAVPEHRMLQYEQLCLFDCSLFGFNVDIEVWIKVVQGAYDYVGIAGCSFEHCLIDK
ncbi:hypothetical protein D3C76_1507510 [compost metagenome]